MPQFTIYSIGDAAFLEQILIAVAMVTGSNELDRMVAIGFMLGVLLVAFQSLFQGAKEVNVGQIGVCAILYFIMFYPVTTVNIENVYDNSVRQVANVPIGVGATGGLISTIGHGITNLFETSYQYISPGAMETEFAEALKMLNASRRDMYDSSVFNAIDQQLGGGDIDFRRSMTNYLIDCTLTKVDLGETSIDQIMNDQTEVAIQFESEIYGTRLYLNSSGGPQDLTCTEAYDLLRTNIFPEVKNLSGVIGNAVSRLIGVDNNPLMEIDNSLTMLGDSATNAQDFVLTSMLEPIYYDAVSGRYRDLNDVSSSVMINQAIQNRNMQWSAEQSMFMTIVRPMVTFFEGLVYAISPLIAFLIVLGGFGIKLAGKYLQTIMWIQLWMPCMSIINLYLHSAASGELDSLRNSASTSSGLNSFYAINSADQVLQHWISTGGMLMASVPVISLFIVTGSSYAMTNIAGRIGGQDHIDEKTSSPDAVKEGPVMDHQAMFKNNAFSGSSMTGTEKAVGGMSFGQTAQSAVSSAQSQMQSANTAFTQNLSKSVSQASTSAEKADMVKDIGQRVTSQNTDQSKALQSQAKSFMEDHGIGQQHQDTVVGAMALEATAGVGASAGVVAGLIGSRGQSVTQGAGGNDPRAIEDQSGGRKPSGGVQNTAGLQKSGGFKASANVNAGAQIKGTATSSANDSSTESSSQGVSLTDGLNFSNEQSRALTSQLAESYSKSNGKSYTSALSEDQSSQLSKSASEAYSATKNYSEASQFADSVGSMTNTDYQTLGGEISSSPEAMQKLDSWFANNASGDVKQQANANAERFEDVYGMRSDVALAAGRLSAMASSGGTDGLSSALDVIGSARGQNLGFDSNPQEYANVAGSLDTAGVQQSANSATAGAPDAMSTSTSGRVAQELGQTPGIEDVQGKVGDAARSDDIANMDQLKSSANQSQAEQAAEQLAPYRDRIMNSEADVSKAGHIMGGIDNASAFVSDTSERIAGAVSGGSEAAMSSLSDSMSDLKTMTPEQRDQFQQDLKEGKGEETGLFSGIANALESGQNTVVGAMATGYDNFKQLLGGESSFSEAAQGMSLEEKGAFYMGALEAATEAGGEALQQFWNENGEDVLDSLRGLAQDNYNLTPAQAEVFAQDFNTFDSSGMDSAVRDLKMEYAERDQNGQPMLESDGSPVLSEENEAFTDAMIERIQDSTSAGDRAGSYLTPISGYNTASEGLNLFDR